MKHKAVFLDRDDTLVEDPGYINHPGQVKLLPGAAASLAQLRRIGYRLVVVSNQSGVARGIVTEETLAQIHHTLEKMLADEGAYLDAIYYCPFHPEGSVPRYRMESELRKPAPGMLLKAAKELDIDLSQSWMVGDSYRDVEAGQRAGCKTILINNPVKPVLKNSGDPEPDRQAVNIREAVNIIRMYEQQHDSKNPAEHLSVHETSEVQVDMQNPKQTITAETPRSIPSPAKSQSAVAVHPVREIPTVEELTPQEQPPVTERKPTVRTDAPLTKDTENLLNEVLVHLKAAYKLGRDEDFSIWMILAGACQIVAVGCLVVSFWFFLDSTRSAEHILIMIGFAAVVQLMTLTFFMMRNRS
ncbi:MAG: HAD family hydrolase [Anaerohalosphaeraceae bacterium]